MDPWSYETQLRIELHQQDLIRQAEQDRRLARAPRTLPVPLRRLLTHAGRRLICLGSQLEARYGDVPAVTPLTVSQKGSM